MLILERIVGQASDPQIADRLHELEHAGAVETLTLSGADSKINLDLASGTRGANYDGVDVGVGTGGAMVYNGDLILTINGQLAAATYNLFDFDTQSGTLDSITFAGTGPYSGTFSNVGGVWTKTSSDQDFTFSQSTGDLVVTPEPTAAMLGFGMALPLLARRRRRIKA